METRIVIGDCHAMFREALKSLLESRPGFTVVGDTDDGEQLTRLISSLRPDLLLFDLNLKHLSGIEVLKSPAASQSSVLAILLTGEITDTEICQALLSGVRGVISKGCCASLLFKSIHAVMSGEYWISHQEMKALVDNMRSAASMADLTSRLRTGNLSQQQQQIIDAIMSGCSNKEIARDLSLSERTIKYHLTRIFSKLGVSGRMELARYSLKNSLVRSVDHDSTSGQTGAVPSGHCRNFPL